ncbi:MAG: putative metal-binding motif-containing protein [Polyangiaceae bacterium]|nr:putative metal-binding motif-containing protein [Polyangiaceae bacterium]
MAVSCAAAADCVSSDPCLVLGCVGGSCVVLEETACDDHDPCTSDWCDPDTGACVFAPRTYDLDGDGHFGPLPGFAPGEPNACGDDCDDTSPRALPGGVERCDGRDNDCNGVIDDLAQWIPEAAEPIRVSAPDALVSMPGGIAHDGALFGVTFHEQRAGWTSRFRGLTASGSEALPPIAVAEADSDAYSGSLQWNGSLFGTVWEDRRDSDYEIYFNRIDAHGQKLGPDVRVSAAEAFSLHPDMLWNGEHFVVVWDDERDVDSRLFGRLVSFDGIPASEEIPLTDLDLEAESPRLAQSRSTLGMVFKAGPVGSQWVGFRTVSTDLATVGTVVELASGGAVEPAIAEAEGRFFVAWNTHLDSFGPAIYGTAVDAVGRIVVPPRQLSSTAQRAASKTWVPLGNRLLLIWSADRGDGYDLYAKLLDTNLRDIGAEFRVTNDRADTASPTAAIGSTGDVGILFRDQRSGPWQVYFTRLACVEGF